MDKPLNKTGISILKTLIVSLLLCVHSGIGKSTEMPKSSIDLKTHSGSYARKSFWVHLNETKIWAEALRKYNTHEVSAVDIDKNGDIIINAKWHEGYPPSAFEFRKDGLWIKSSASDWTGPFIRVGDSRNDGVIYFNKIFGNQCYTSNKNERWCFQSGAIDIDGTKYKAELIPELMGMPTYGTPVNIEGYKELIVFVPTNNGWRIFQDTAYESDINPYKAVPWRELSHSN